jgi:hypothetical protein
MHLNLSLNNTYSMETVKPGRPREWVLDEEIIEIHRLAADLKAQNPKMHWSDIQKMLRTQLEKTNRSDFLSKLDKLWGLMRHAIPLPPRCICGGRVYSYTYKKGDGLGEHSWEIFARCVNPSCRYMRRYLPMASYKWSRPKSIIKELEKIPTFYELDGQKVEEEKE